MAISVKTQKMLWGRAANRCAFPECRRELVIDASETDDESLIGDACHIVADSENGPRGKSPLSAEERDKYANLMLLCKVHHKVIDDQHHLYTVERLCQIKREHEQWVAESLHNFDPAKQRDDERYAAIVEEWAMRVDLDHWTAWSSYIFGGGDPHLHIGHAKELEELMGWLLSRIWPRRYTQLEGAFENFRRVIQDFYNIFRKYAVNENGSDCLWTEKVYRRGYGDQALTNYFMREYEFHVDLVQDLMLELTRAANYICDHVRQYLVPSFRIKEGALLVVAGPYSDLSFRTYRVEYRDEERVMIPYPGLDKFKQIRTTRDGCFGKGIDANDTEAQIEDNDDR
jgi:hypothetical protein